MRRPIAVPRRPFATIIAILALPLLAVLGCADSSPTSSPDAWADSPSAQLIDGSTDGEYEGFLFLPPLVPDPSRGGQSAIPGLAPHVEICLLDTSDPEWVCEAGAPYRTFTPSEIVYEADYYKVEWDTQDPAYGPVLTSDPNGDQFTYRLTVFLGPLELGLVDLQFGGSGGAARNLTTDEVVGLNGGRTVPVKFFIGSALETDLGCVTGLDCRVATFPAGEEFTVVTRDGDAVLHIPAGATSGNGPIVTRITELENCDLGVGLPWYNSCYEYDLFPDQVFSEAVIVAQCIDTSSVPPGRLAELQLGARHDDPPAGIPAFELLPNVAAPATLSCDDYVPGPEPTGVLAALKDAGRGVGEFLFGTPAYAGHSGLGGAARDLSTIAWVDPGLRVAGFDVTRGGWSSIESPQFEAARQALLDTYGDAGWADSNTDDKYPNVWLTTGPELNSTLLDEEVDVVILGSVYGSTTPIAPMSAAERDALHEYVEHGGCAILLTDNGSFAASNASLVQGFGLTTTGTLSGNLQALTQGRVLQDGITSFLQRWSGWFDGTGQGTVLATNQNRPAMVEIGAGVVGSHSGPVFAFSDVNMFLSNAGPNDQYGVIALDQNRDLFLNTVAACGTEPLAP